MRVCVLILRKGVSPNGLDTDECGTRVNGEPVSSKQTFMTRILIITFLLFFL